MFLLKWQDFVTLLFFVPKRFVDTALHHLLRSYCLMQIFRSQFCYRFDDALAWQWGPRPDNLVKRCGLLDQ